MIRNAAHRRALLQSAVFSSQGKFQFFRNSLGILKKHLIEIAKTIKQNTVRILFFRLQIMSHHW